jgi:hypothetical protein
MPEENPMRAPTLLSWTAVLAAAALVASGAAQAHGNNNQQSWWYPPPPPPWYQYSVSFTCGHNASDLLHAVPGDYAFAVNVFNMSNTAVASVVKQVMLTNPPGGEQAGDVSSPIQETVPIASAMQVSCAEILNEFVYPSGAPTGLVQGVLVIKSSLFLDASATHFATGANGGISQNITPVAAIAIPPAPLSAASSITICHIPPGNPGNAHTITIDVSAWPAHQAHGDYQGACTDGH